MTESSFRQKKFEKSVSSEQGINKIPDTEPAKH